MQYFCKNKQRDHTLAELFAKVPFHYSLSSDEEELVTYMAYKELATDHERVRRITASQHDELISIFERRLPRGSRIQADYIAHKSRDDESPKTWEVAMMRIIAVVTAARETIRMSGSYGNPDIVYSFPSTAVSPPRRSGRVHSLYVMWIPQVGVTTWRYVRLQTYRWWPLSGPVARAATLHIF